MREEVDLYEYLLVFWRWKYFIAGMTGVFLILAIAMGFLLPRQYEARVTFLVTPPKVILEPTSQVEAHYRLYLETYRGIIKSKRILKDTIKKFKIPLSLEQFERLVTVRAVPNSRLISLRVRFAEPEMAAKIANYIATQAVELNRQLSQGEEKASQEFLSGELRKAERDLKKVEKELEWLKGKRVSFKDHVEGEGVALRVEVDGALAVEINGKGVLRLLGGDLKVLA